MLMTKPGRAETYTYRLAPEYKFPTGVLDSWDALKWVR